jgi:hypothetical protein
MLVERQYQLLTAYVDGELDARQRKLVQRLVAESEEARAFLTKLESDSKELRESPRHKAPATLPDLVMETLTEGLAHPVLPSTATPSAIPIWLGLALAACVLLAVSVASYFTVSGLLGRPEPDVANKPTVVPAAKQIEAAPPELYPFVGDLLSGAAKKYAEPVPDKDAGMRLVLSELREEPVQKRLANELQKKAGMWLDVPVADAAQGVERVTEAFQKSGIKVLAAKSKKDPKVVESKQYLLYTENLRPEELTRILDQLGTGRAVEQVVLKGMAKDDHQRLADALHVSWKEVTPSKLGGNMVDIPILVQGEQQPKGPILKGGKGVERLAILLPIAANGNPSTLPEVQQFLNARQAQNQGALQIVMIIRDKKAV